MTLCTPGTCTGSPPSARDALLERATTLDVFPLVFHRLQRLGVEQHTLQTDWEKRFRANAARNLYLHHEQERLVATLAAAELLALPLKGTTLAEEAYGDLSLRTQVDIDLYVRPGQLSAALDVLTECGYRPVIPTGLRRELLAATGDAYTSECGLASFSSGKPVLLELHWRILPMADDTLAAVLVSSQAGEGVGRRLRLPRDWNFLYLCLHASADRWASLKSLADLTHWIVRQPPDWERLLAAAARLRLRRILLITLLALQSYFAPPIPEEVLAALEPARPRRLPAAAIGNPFAPPNPLTPAAIHRVRLALRENVRDRLAYAVRRLRPTPRDLATIRLPRFLESLYWLIHWGRGFSAGLSLLTARSKDARATGEKPFRAARLSSTAGTKDSRLYQRL
ncbi:MAG: nucleotidyltransferase family protein [Terriglobia bacterium]